VILRGQRCIPLSRPRRHGCSTAFRWGGYVVPSTQWPKLYLLSVEIVERDSGTIESENEPIEIDVDHSGLNKCHSRDSRLYIELCTAVRKVIDYSKLRPYTDRLKDEGETTSGMEQLVTYHQRCLFADRTSQLSPHACNICLSSIYAPRHLLRRGRLDHS